MQYVAVIIACAICFLCGRAYEASWRDEALGDIDGMYVVDPEDLDEMIREHNAMVDELNELRRDEK